MGGAGHLYREIKEKTQKKARIRSDDVVQVVSMQARLSGWPIARLASNRVRCPTPGKRYDPTQPTRLQRYLMSLCRRLEIVGCENDYDVFVDRDCCMWPWCVDGVRPQSSRSGPLDRHRIRHISAHTVRSKGVWVWGSRYKIGRSNKEYYRST